MIAREHACPVGQKGGGKVKSTYLLPHALKHLATRGCGCFEAARTRHAEIFTGHALVHFGNEHGGMWLRAVVVDTVPLLCLCLRLHLYICPMSLSLSLSLSFSLHRAGVCVCVYVQARARACVCVRARARARARACVQCRRPLTSHSEPSMSILSMTLMSAYLQPPCYAPEYRVSTPHHATAQGKPCSRRRGST